MIVFRLYLLFGVELFFRAKESTSLWSKELLRYGQLTSLPEKLFTLHSFQDTLRTPFSAAGRRGTRRSLFHSCS